MVEYRDLVNDEDDTKQLRERVDKLHIRPSPPEQSKDQFIHNHEYIIYFLQKKEEMIFNHAKLCPNLEFINNK